MSGVKTNAMRILDKHKIAYKTWCYKDSGAVSGVAAELDLKKAARAVNEKSVEMIKQKELLPLTGYVHGGCSPIGMKKQFATTIHHTAADFGTIIFSAGMIGWQVEMPLADLQTVVPAALADITA